MGHFSHTCKLSKLPIVGGTNVVLFPMVMRDKLYEHSDESLRKYGTTYMCSNEGSRLKFIPCYLPIRGKYDDYGGIKDIIEDDGTEILENYFGLSIQEICNIITCNRKKDGYSESLNCIKDTNTLDKNGKKFGEKGFEDYNNPQYLERYKELLKVSGMWVHGDVYDKLTDKNYKIDEYNGLSLGNPNLLECLGFTEQKKKGDDERYHTVFQKGSLKVNSDGTWIEIPNETIYRISDFAKYCEKMGEPIKNLEEHLNKTYVEQLYDYVIPKFENFWKRPKEVLISDEELDIKIEKRIETWCEIINSELSHDEAKKQILDEWNGVTNLHSNEQSEKIAYHLLNGDYRTSKISNPLTYDYFDACREGLLREELRRFWIFDSYLYATGTFYDIVGTSPQDGDIDSVKEVLDISKNIADVIYEEYRDEEDDDEE
jgi:hypothetical protein